jgi:hypothetical protein
MGNLLPKSVGAESDKREARYVATETRESPLVVNTHKCLTLFLHSDIAGTIFVERLFS